MVFSEVLRLLVKVNMTRTMFLKGCLNTVSTTRNAIPALQDSLH